MLFADGVSRNLVSPPPPPQYRVSQFQSCSAILGSDYCIAGCGKNYLVQQALQYKCMHFFSTVQENKRVLSANSTKTACPLLKIKAKSTSMLVITNHIFVSPSLVKSSMVIWRKTGSLPDCHDCTEEATRRRR